MDGWKETHRAVVFPWQCDQFGHMNVRWYAHWFDDAAFHLWPTSGVTFRRMVELGIHTVVARTETDFVRELSAGDLVVVRSGFVRLGRSSVTYAQRMLNAETETLHARQRATEVFFDPATRGSATIPDEIRAAIEPALIDPD
jgi:acyl-CoA thioester hydrolase